MDKKLKECGEKLRKLVSDVQGAPYPGNLEDELYMIWYEHIQKTAIECFEFLDENIGFYSYIGYHNVNMFFSSSFNKY